MSSRTLTAAIVLFTSLSLCPHRLMNTGLVRGTLEQVAVLRLRCLWSECKHGFVTSSWQPGGEFLVTVNVEHLSLVQNYKTWGKLNF